MKNNRDYIGIDLSEEYIKMSRNRFEQEFSQYSLFY